MIWYGIFIVFLAAFIFLPRLRVIVFSMFIVFAFVGSTEILGVAKPSRVEWRSPSVSEVIAYHLVEGKAIYLWIRTKNGPMSYNFPWSTKLAQRIQKAFRKNKLRRGTGVFIRNLFTKNKLDRPRKFLFKHRTTPPKRREPQPFDNLITPKYERI